jgi:hypothetical protein
MTFLNFSQLPESVFRPNFPGKHFPENQAKFSCISIVIVLVLKHSCISIVIHEYYKAGRTGKTITTKIKKQMMSRGGIFQARKAARTIIADTLSSDKITIVLFKDTGK